MQSNPFAVNHDDPIALTLLQRQLKKGTKLTFYKNGALMGGISAISRASGGFKAGFANRTPVPGFFSLNYTRGSETLTSGECHRLKFERHGDELRVHLRSL